MQASDNVAEFPFLSDAEFDQACGQIEAVSDYKHLRTPTSILRYTKRIPTRQETTTMEENDLILEETDEAAIVRPLELFSSLVFDVMLSPTYRVPIVYVYGSVGQISNEHIYNLLVPDHQKSAMEKTGIMGALTMTDHPATGMPSYFVHPCRTADALRASRAETDRVTPVEYMMLWFGIIGASVGLSLPTEVALRAQK